MLRIVAFAAFGGLLVGYDLGLIGGALQGIKVELGLSEGQQVRAVPTGQASQSQADKVRAVVHSVHARV